ALATHEIVQFAHPREVTERDEIGMATGLAIDGALGQMSHEAGLGRRPTATATRQVAESILDRELTDADLSLPPEERDRIRQQIVGVIAAFRKSALFGLPRPKSRMILIDGRVGVYAQPDYWNRVDTIYEMKSYHPTTIPPAVDLQLR